MNQKMAIIGWDAATFDALFPLLEAGALPNLKGLMARGAWGSLMSTRHPLSPTAWASFMTGMNPGKHGIFDFVGQTEDGQFGVTNGGALKAKTLWARLSQAGRRIAVINVPMTYPPEAVNGYLIAGMDAPQQDRAFTYPPELAEQLQARLGGYREGVPTRAPLGMSAEHFAGRYVDELCQVTRLQGQAACHLLEREALDFLMVVFTTTDRIQHALGHLLAQGITPDDGIGRVYAACDQAMGDILSRLDETWSIMVMSDHGACAYHRVFELGTWLETQGWLRLRPQPGSTPLTHNLARLRRGLARLAGRPEKSQLHVQRFLDRIVWPETQAFALGAFGSIYIAARDRFPGGSVQPGAAYRAVRDQITEQLLATRDPETDQLMVSAVHSGEQVYHGRYAHLAPDLLVETTADYFIRNNLDHQSGHLTYPAGNYAGRSLAHTGKHTLQGVLIAAGPPFAPGGNRLGADIMDLAPTALYLSGQAVDGDMDGKVLTDWLDPAYCQAHPLTRSAPAAVQDKQPGGTPEAAYSTQEASLVEERLRDLGYMD